MPMKHRPSFSKIRDTVRNTHLDGKKEEVAKKMHEKPKGAIEHYANKMGEDKIAAWKKSIEESKKKYNQ